MIKRLLIVLLIIPAIYFAVIEFIVYSIRWVITGKSLIEQDFLIEKLIEWK